MDVSENVTATLRAQDHGHPPLVLIYDARGNGGGGNLPDHNRRSSKPGDGLHSGGIGDV